jgi:hypothetical protein
MVNIHKRHDWQSMFIEMYANAPLFSDFVCCAHVPCLELIYTPSKYTIIKVTLIHDQLVICELGRQDVIWFCEKWCCTLNFAFGSSFSPLVYIISLDCVDRS